LWNALEVLLEADGAADLATVSPARRGEAADRNLRARYAVLSLVMLDAPPTARVPSASGGDAADMTPRPAEHQASSLVVVGGAVTFDNVPGQNTVQGMLGGVDLIAPLVRAGRASTVEVSLRGGGGIDMGTWRNAFAGVLSGDLGIAVRAGAPYGAIFSLLYTPSALYAEGRAAASLKAYRASAGIQLGHDVAIGVSWQEIGRGADSPLRMLAGYVEVGL
jgi:hypothetical protein